MSAILMYEENLKEAYEKKFKDWQAKYEKQL